MEGDNGSPAEQVAPKIKTQLEALRMDAQDFRLSPGWPLPYTIASIETFFNTPLDIPVSAGHWADHVENATQLLDYLTTAANILNLSLPTTALNPLKSINKTIPIELHKPVGILLGSLQQAQPYLNRAVDSLSKEARQGLLDLNSWPDVHTGAIKQEISSRRIKANYDNLSTFSESDLYTAGAVLFKALDAALPEITSSVSLRKNIRWRTPQGTVLISGGGDDIYERKDLEGVSLLIDLGGKNTYRTPVARAYEKEIRMVIDLGTDVRVEGENDFHGNAGSGVFGIGILILPNAAGLKSINTDNFSQGFGMAGIGVLLVHGKAHLSAQRSTQGMGIFGLGLLIAKEAHGSSYVATRSGQGSALTRGVGVFLHEGNEGDIKGGLVQPDPREPLGSVSLCQGVGFGPRAYAGGGVGIAVIKGNNNTVKGSYFSQGVGYWHGFGVYRLHGNHNITQARRYDMGSGVHSAFGHMDVFGDHNRILNWGVGPAYGWDKAIGSSLIIGDHNEMQTEWGAGTASIGSLSFSLIQGQYNKLKLCDFGTNNFFRDEPAYSVQVIEGLNNQLQCQGVAPTNGERLRRLRSPWGLFQINQTELVDNLELMAPVWPELPREEGIERESVDLQAHMEQAREKPALDEVGDLLDVAAAFSLDKVTPRKALLEILKLPPEKATLLVDIVEPAALDQLIQLSIAIPAHGTVSADKLLATLTNEQSPQKKATLINFLRLHRPSLVVPALLEIMKTELKEEFKVQLLRTLSALLNKDSGNEPGPRAAWLQLEPYLKNPNKDRRERVHRLLQRIRFGECFGLLASTLDLSPEEREEFFESAPPDLTGNSGPESATAFLKILNGRKKESLAGVTDQLKTLAKLEPLVRSNLTELLQSTKTASINNSLIGLGHIGNAEDAQHVAPFLQHTDTRVRESATIALGRLGQAGIPFLLQALTSDSFRDRSLALVAITQATHPKTLSLLNKGWGDSNPLVRLTALTVLDNLSESLRTHRPKLVKRAKKILANDSDPDVRLALQLLK